MGNEQSGASGVGNILPPVSTLSSSASSPPPVSTSSTPAPNVGITIKPDSGLVVVPEKDVKAIVDFRRNVAAMVYVMWMIAIVILVCGTSVFIYKAISKSAAKLPEQSY